MYVYLYIFDFYAFFVEWYINLHELFYAKAIFREEQ